MQERIAFVHLKTGCTGDEASYKGKPKDARYTLDKQSDEWLTFRLRTFDLYKNLFQPAEGIKIDLLFNCVDVNQEGRAGLQGRAGLVREEAAGGIRHQERQTLPRLPSERRAVLIRTLDALPHRFQESEAVPRAHV